MSARFSKPSFTMIFATLAALIPTTASLAAEADPSVALRADAAQIDADVAQLQQDQQKLHDLVQPDRQAVQAAQKQLDQDAAPLQTHLKASEDAAAALLKADHDAVKLARQQGEATIRAMEAQLEQDRRRAGKDKAVAAQLSREEEQIKAAREKLKADLELLETKLKSDAESSKKALTEERASMDKSLQPDTDALTQAQRRLQDDLMYATKVDADQATLDADRQKLSADKAAAGQ